MGPNFDRRALQVLAAVLEHRHVGRAAAALGIGQPTVSYHLARLREVLGDPLFVRHGRGVAPTARLLALEGRLRDVLAAAEALVEPAAFDPRRADREVRIASLDYERLLLLAPVVAALAGEAPGLRLALLGRTARDLEALADGRLDLCVGPLPEAPGAGVRQRLLYRDRAACVLRAGHPLAGARRPMTLAQFAAYPHVSVIVEDTPGFALERYLARRGLARRLLARVAGFETTCEVVARTDALALVPARLAERARGLGLEVRGVPLRPAEFGIYLVWHERAHRDPLNAWLRGRLAEAAAAL